MAAELRPIVWEGTFLRGVLYLGTLGSVGTFLTQTWAQRHMSATHAAIIFALEPVWAALLAVWLLEERLGATGLWGGALVLAGIVVSELRLRR
jgi:drug/metabolite transporter (DMT)-like permease